MRKGGFAERVEVEGFSVREGRRGSAVKSLEGSFLVLQRKLIRAAT